MSKPVGLCSPASQMHVDKVGKSLGITLPDCAAIRTTEDGGIKALQRDAVGNVKIMEVSGKGQIFFSSYCSQSGGNCQHIPTTQQSGSVSPAKLAAARKLILGKE